MSVIRLGLERGTPEQRAEEKMVEICCDALESSVEAGVLQVNPMRGVLYVRAPGKYWAVRYCPFCGKPRERTETGRRRR